MRQNRGDEEEQLQDLDGSNVKSELCYAKKKHLVSGSSEALCVASLLSAPDI